MSALMAWALAGLLGLGLPRSFALLYVLLITSAVRRWSARPRVHAPVLGWSVLWLVLFGISYAAAQWAWGVWVPAESHLPEILAVLVLPAAGLAVGWLLAGVGRSRLITGLIVAYGAGALIYALLSLAASRTPWWNLAQTFELLVKVPWGDAPFTNMRSVEQRAFLALALLPVGVPLLWDRRRASRWLGMGLVVMAGLAAHVAWAYQGRIGLAVLALAALPGMWLLPAWVARGWTALAAFGAVGLAGWCAGLCDERWWLQTTFLQHLAAAPWGGRLIQFSYQDCRPGVLLRFGSFANSDASSPHNVLLDVYNDGGWIPSICLVLGLAPLTFSLLRGFLKFFRLQGWSAGLAVRWSAFSLLVVQWILQPFMYSDQLMFSLGFVLFGALLAEFTADAPGGWRAAKPSRLRRSA
jgi:hypothetical protein